MAGWYSEINENTYEYGWNLGPAEEQHSLKLFLSARVVDSVIRALD